MLFFRYIKSPSSAKEYIYFRNKEASNWKQIDIQLEFICPYKTT